jgi:hypothetical protein
MSFGVGVNVAGSSERTRSPAHNTIVFRRRISAIRAPRVRVAAPVRLPALVPSLRRANLDDHQELQREGEGDRVERVGASPLAELGVEVPSFEAHPALLVGRPGSTRCCLSRSIERTLADFAGRARSGRSTTTAEFTQSRPLEKYAAAGTGQAES